MKDLEFLNLKLERLSSGILIGERSVEDVLL